MSAGWDILKRGDACAACARAFAAGEAVTTRLEADGAQLLRKDFCAACWEAAPSLEAGIHWRSRVPEPKSAKKELFDAAGLFEALKRLLEEGRPEQERLCYLLALFCCRKRLLKLKGIHREGAVESLVFVAPRSRREYRIRAMDLTPGDMAAARDEMARISAGA